MTEEAQAALDDGSIIDGPDDIIEDTESPDTTAVSEETEVPSEAPVVEEASKEQKALNKLAFENREKNRQFKAAQEEIERLKSQVPAQPVVQGEPKLEDFDYDDSAFQAALIDYKVNEGLKTVEQRQVEQRAEETRNAVQANFQAKGVELAKTNPNYVENLSNLPEFPIETLNTILSMDGGNEVANYLGAHANIADELASMNPMQAALKLGQISSQLSTLKPAIKTSAAPDPIDPLVSSGSLAVEKESPLIDGATFE